EVDEGEEPPEGERDELVAMSARAPPERVRAEEREQVERRTPDEPERSIEEQAERPGLRREREHLLLVADEVVAGTRHEEPELPLVHVREDEDQRGERRRAGDDARERERPERAIRDDEPDSDDREPGPGG